MSVRAIQSTQQQGQPIPIFTNHLSVTHPVIAGCSVNHPCLCIQAFNQCLSRKHIISQNEQATI